MPESPLVQINVAQLLAEKNPALARWMPRFVLHWLERIIRQTEVNEALRLSQGIEDIDFARWTMQHFDARISSVGINNVPQNQSVIVASNHPLGGFDGIALLAELSNRRLDLRFIVNDILTKIPNFKEVFVGVDKIGVNSRSALNAVEQLYQSDMAILIFPAGLCSRRQPDGQITDLRWNRSFVTKAIRYETPIVPTFIRGRNSNWFYNLSYWRKKIGIKANIEMLFLPDEMFRQRGKSVHIIFGKPIPASTFDATRKPEEWGEILRRFVYELDQNPAADFKQFAATQSNSLQTATLS